MTTSLDTLVKEQISKLNTESSNEESIFQAVLECMVGYYQTQSDSEESKYKALMKIVYNLRSVKGEFPKYSTMTAGKYFDEAVKVLGKLKKEAKDEDKKQAIEKVKNHIDG